MDTCLTFDKYSFSMESMKEYQAHLLIVDDNPVTLRLLKAMLSQAGYAVLEAKHGKQALEILESRVPDLILLDIDMPDLSGLETCVLIKKNARTAEIPIIFVTSSNEKDDIVAGFAAGAQDYIIKPSTREELLARVNTHLQLCRAQQAIKASRAKYRELSYRDDLTGLYNTRYLYKTLAAHLEKQAEQPLSVVFIDIDRFKQVVDGHGHLHGSRTIAEVAGVIRQMLPNGCFGVSYGGDEFVVVLPAFDTEATCRFAERLCKQIATHTFLTAQNLAIHLTVSCGLATYPADAATMVELLGNADQALFATKHRGRNGVISYAELQEQQPPHLLPLQ